uniref:Uncharacterized protein n=1 Tax=Physcomitrium patens TaxID=3218 RepID=A0A2K1JM31_PHYPA|nr:hypothetical protein PHYPA_017430 [Physcomitrium patens]
MLDKLESGFHSCCAEPLNLLTRSGQMLIKDSRHCSQRARTKSFISLICQFHPHPSKRKRTPSSLSPILTQSFSKLDFCSIPLVEPR